MKAHQKHLPGPLFLPQKESVLRQVFPSGKKQSYNFCEIIIYPPAYTDCCISYRKINKTLSDIFFIHCKCIQTAQKNWDYITERSKNRNDCFVLRNQILIVVKISSLNFY